jgi:hypothetical protein
MRNPPELSWPIRLASLAVAAGLSLYVLEIYAFGAKFVALVAALGTPAVQSTAAPPVSSQPGVTSVSIVSDSKRAP